MAKKQQMEGAQFVRYFGPLLDALRTLGGSGTPSEVVEQIAADLKISDEAQADLLPSGTPRFPNQVAWARFHLAREGLLDASKRGVWSLTDKGRGTSLSADQARALFLKWVRVFAEERKRRQDETPHPPEATPPMGLPSRVVTARSYLRSFFRCRLAASSGCLSAFFASPASCKWP